MSIKSQMDQQIDMIDKLEKLLAEAEKKKSHSGYYA